MFGVEAEDALLLEPLLRERIIGCQRGRQDRWHDERQDVETVEQDFVHGSLKAGVGVIGLPIRGNDVMTSRRQNRQASSLESPSHPFLGPHVERVCHSDEAEREEHVDRLDEVAVKLEVQRRREEDRANQLALCRRKA